jgi:hypothetical protein
MGEILGMDDAFFISEDLMVLPFETVGALISVLA